MEVNKIEIIQGSQTTTPIDLTQDTVTASDVRQGVTVHLPSGEQVEGTSTAITPTGTLNITDNGTYDVTEYASAEVSVSGGGGSANPYEDVIDSQSTNNKGHYLFAYCQDTDQQFANHFTSSVKAKMDSLNGTFIGCSNLTNIDLTGIPTGSTKIKSAAYMFQGCTGITTVGGSSNDSVNILQLANFVSTGGFTSTTRMFSGCTNLTSVELLQNYIGFDNQFSERVKDTEGMFYNCKLLNHVTLPYGFYEHPTTTTTGFPSNDVSNMFYNCKALTYIDLTALNTRSILDSKGGFYKMFGGQNSSNYCGVQTIDWGIDFVIPNYVKAYKMFYLAKDLSVINYQGTKSDWKTNIYNYDMLFTSSQGLYENNLTQQQITVVCYDGIFNYQNDGSGDFVITDTYTLQRATYSDGNTSYTFDTSGNKEVEVNGNPKDKHNYTITINGEIVVSDLGLTFTMTAGDSSWNATQLTDQNSNVYTLVV